MITQNLLPVQKTCRREPAAPIWEHKGWRLPDLGNCQRITVNQDHQHRQYLTDRRTSPLSDLAASAPQDWPSCPKFQHQRWRRLPQSRRSIWCYPLFPFAPDYHPGHYWSLTFWSCGCCFQILLVILTNFLRFALKILR